ncbi:uncharacterized, partial [Tachysurus ichikawai]
LREAFTHRSNKTAPSPSAIILANHHPPNVGLHCSPKDEADSQSKVYRHLEWAELSLRSS